MARPSHRTGPDADTVPTVSAPTVLVWGTTQRRLKLPRPLTTPPRTTHCEALRHTPSSSAAPFLHKLHVSASPPGAIVHVWQSPLHEHARPSVDNNPTHWMATSLVVLVVATPGATVVTGGGTAHRKPKRPRPRTVPPALRQRGCDTHTSCSSVARFLHRRQACTVLTPDMVHAWQSPPHQHAPPTLAICPVHVKGGPSVGLVTTAGVPPSTTIPPQVFPKFPDPRGLPPNATQSLSEIHVSPAK